MIVFARHELIATDHLLTNIWIKRMLKQTLCVFNNSTAILKFSSV